MNKIVFKFFLALPLFASKVFLAESESESARKELCKSLEKGIMISPPNNSAQQEKRTFSFGFSFGPSFGPKNMLDAFYLQDPHYSPCGVRVKDSASFDVHDYAKSFSSVQISFDWGFENIKIDAFGKNKDDSVLIAKAKEETKQIRINTVKQKEGRKKEEEAYKENKRAYYADLERARRERQSRND